MKIRSGLIAAVALVAIWPAIADAQHLRGGGGGGGGRAAISGGGGRAVIGGGGFNRGGMNINRGGATMRSGSAMRLQNRSAIRAQNRAALRAQSRSGLNAQTRSALRSQDRARLRAATPARQLAATDRARRWSPTRTQLRQLRTARAEAMPRRFGARFYSDRWRYYHGPSWWAWRHGWYAGWVGWYGGLFWPFVYADVFNWAFWPWGYAPGYWYYAYDDFFDGVFYGYEPAPVRYARRGAPPPATGASYAQAQDLCKQPMSGVTAWPIADIERAVQPTDEQRRLLAQLKDVSEQAAQKFAVTCPAENDLAGTAPGRLATIIGRLQATEDVITTVKPAFEAFYSSLSDDQKTRFDAVGPNETRMANRRPRTTVGSANGQADQCGNVNAGLTDLPMQQIELAVRPTEAQQDAFKQLQEATAKAVDHLRANCPREAAPPTPSARLDAMQTNIHAMIEAGEMIRPALENFYGSLDETQKARFNRLDRKMASAE